MIYSLSLPINPQNCAGPGIIRESISPSAYVKLDIFDKAQTAAVTDVDDFFIAHITDPHIISSGKEVSFYFMREAVSSFRIPTESIPDFSLLPCLRSNC